MSTKPDAVSNTWCQALDRLKVLGNERMRTLRIYAEDRARIMTRGECLVEILDREFGDSFEEYKEE